MRAMLLVGSVSVFPGIGTSMIRLAARLEESGVVAIAAAGFIAGTRPTVDEALAVCLKRGASEIVLQPYSLLQVNALNRELRRLRRELSVAEPQMRVHIARPLGDHPMLGQIVLQRAHEADYAVAHGITAMPMLLSYNSHVVRPPAIPLHRADLLASQLVWRPVYEHSDAGLLLVAHGGERAGWSGPLLGMREWLRLQGHFREVDISYLSRGTPAVDRAIEQMAQRGMHTIVVVPYLLQLTNEDIAQLIGLTERATQAEGVPSVIVAQHLSYDRKLVTIVGDRMYEALGQSRSRLARMPLTQRAV